MRVLSACRQEELNAVLKRLEVDPYGIKIMLPKGVNHLIRLDSVSSIAANILKQEMLSLGGDVALPRAVLTSKQNNTDCLLIGTLSQFTRLSEKLKVQPFGLSNLSKELHQTLENFNRDKFVLKLGRFRMELCRRTHIMGIVNLTPDSFSQDGLYKDLPRVLSNKRSHKKLLSDIAECVKSLVEDGADIIDVGGESSRPGARPVPLKEELARTIPVIKILSKKIKAPVSIDTYKPEVARQALDNGAVIVNDITGLKDVRLAKVIAKYKAGVVLMHMKARPRTMQANPKYDSLIDEIIFSLDEAVKRALDAGIESEKIIVDPGIGFGKTLGHNLEILKKLHEFKTLGKPILVGTSRKSFLGKILNCGIQDRTAGTIASCVLAAANGAHIVRVHDVKEVRSALRVADSVLKMRE